MVGCEEKEVKFLKDSASHWSTLVDRLTVIAEDQPQVAYCALLRSIQNKWKFAQRLTSGYDYLFADLQHKIATELLPTLFGCEISEYERIICSLPT